MNPMAGVGDFQIDPSTLSNLGGDPALWAQYQNSLAAAPPQTAAPADPRAQWNDTWERKNSGNLIHAPVSNMPRTIPPSPAVIDASGNYTEAGWNHGSAEGVQGGPYGKTAEGGGMARPTPTAVAPSDPLAATPPVTSAGGVTVNPQGLTNPSVPTITATPSAAFDYSKLSSGEPQLVKAGASYLNNSTGQMVPAGTDHYVARTNDGDFAGTVMVAPGQKIRMVDKITGDVVFEGTGPEGAKQATAIANAMSQDKGRKAAWSIEAENEQGGYTQQAAERYDPKKQGFFGKLADFALPIIGAIVGGPIGAALGSAASSVAQGRNLKQTLVRGALSGAGAWAAPGITNAVTGAFGQGAAGGISQGAAAAADFGAALGSGGVNAATNTITNAAGAVLGGGALAGSAAQIAASVAAKGVENTIAELVVTGLPRAAATSLVNSAIGAGGGALLGGIAGDTLAPPSANMPPSQPQSQPPTDVEEVIVTALRDKGLSVQDLVKQGIPLGAIQAAQAKYGLNTIDEVVVEPTAKPPPTNIPFPAVLPPTTEGFVDLNTSPLPPAIPPADPVPATLLAALATGSPAAIGAWITAHPLQAAALGLTVGGALLGGGGSGGRYTPPSGPGSPGTRESLSPTFSAQLPTATFGTRAPRDVTVDKRYAIQHPEASFFSHIPQRGIPDFAVPTPMQNRQTGVGDLNGDGLMDALDLAIWKRRYAGRGYARGGNVHGPGDGRSDSIPAELSDGEYVIDAETVALLGNGSTRAGADKLDQFRVAVRKHKGRELVKGHFSAEARAPHAYMGSH